MIQVVVGGVLLVVVNKECGQSRFHHATRHSQEAVVRPTRLVGWLVDRQLQLPWSRDGNNNNKNQQSTKEEKRWLPLMQMHTLRKTQKNNNTHTQDTVVVMTLRVLLADALGCSDAAK